MAKSPKSAPAANQPQSSGAPPSDMPLFYSTVAPVDSIRHAGKSIKATTDFSFARATNAVPLNAVEFVHALRNYPIVFSASKPIMTLAVLGVRQDANLFVNAKGKWRDGTYIPAYIRRYPFIFIGGEETDNLILGIDEAAPQFGDDGSPLFVDGQPSAHTKNALAFCAEYQNHLKLTQQFCEAVAEQGLLVDQSASFEFSDKQRATIQGFQIVDEAKFRALPDSVIVEWRKNGYLPLVFAHLFSMRSWADLLDLAAAPATA